MSERMDDDELRAMLEARANRMPSTDGREVLASIHAEVRGARGGAGLAVLPVVLGGRGGKASAGWVAIGLVAVMVLAVMGGKLGSGPAKPGAGDASASTSAAPATTSSNAATAESFAPRTVTMDALRAGLAAGTLEGRIVLVTGRLQVLAWPCPFPVPDDCYGLQLRGLEGVDVTHAGLMTRDEARARIDGDPSDRQMAFRVTGFHLALMGWLTPGPDSPWTVGQLAGQGALLPTGNLAVVSGWLLGATGSAACAPGASPSACTGSQPWLADQSPVVDGTPRYGQGVNVATDPAVSVSPSPAVVRGLFLVRPWSPRGGGLPAAFQIVATLDPAMTLRVEPATLSATLDRDGFLAAVGDGSFDGRIVLVQGELQSVAWPCPSGMAEPCTRMFIPGLDGIAVTWDGAQRSTNDPGGSAPGDGAATPAPSAATLVVVPRDGHLELLGRLTGDLEHPDTLSELMYQRRLIGVDDLLALAPVAGWLVVGGIHSCPFMGPGATPCPGPGPTLTDKQPLTDGLMTSDVQAQVVIGRSAVGIVAGQVVTPGPFLYRVAGPRACDDVGSSCRSSWGWMVVARYDASQVIRVSIP